MKFTSASANKYLRKLQDEKTRLLHTEQEVCTYELSEGEEAEPPSYDYEAIRARIDEIDNRVRTVRNALHGFNMRTVLPTSGISIDEALILLAQFSTKKDRLSSLASRQPKERIRERFFGSGSGSVEYRYANYDVVKAEADYCAVADRIAELQLELDLVNQTETFAVDL